VRLSTKGFQEMGAFFILVNGTEETTCLPWYEFRDEGIGPINRYEPSALLRNFPVNFSLRYSISA